MSQQVLSNIIPSVDTIKTTLGMAPSIPKSCKAVLFKEKGAALSVEEVPVKEPSAGEVLIKVEACGVCHSDSAVVSRPGLTSIDQHALTDVSSKKGSWATPSLSFLATSPSERSSPWVLE